MWRKRDKKYILGQTDSMSTGKTARTKPFSMIRREKSKTLEILEETLKTIWFRPLISQIKKLGPKKGSGLEPRFPDSMTSAFTLPTTPYLA